METKEKELFSFFENGSQELKFKTFKVGEFVFANGERSTDIHAFDNPIGIIAWISANRRADKGKRFFILALEEHIGNMEEAKAMFKNMSFLRDETSSDGFLPNNEDWQKILKNETIINQSLQSANLPLLGDWYWSSSRYGMFDAWIVDAKSGSYSAQAQHSVAKARCVVRI